MVRTCASLRRGLQAVLVVAAVAASVCARPDGAIARQPQRRCEGARRAVAPVIVTLGRQQVIPPAGGSAPRPYSEAGTVMAPLRPLAGALNRAVNYDAGTHRLILGTPRENAYLQLGSAEIATRDGLPITTLPVPPTMCGGIVFVPLRPIASLLDATTLWRPTAQVIDVRASTAPATVPATTSPPPPVLTPSQAPSAPVPTTTPLPTGVMPSPTSTASTTSPLPTPAKKTPAPKPAPTGPSTDHDVISPSPPGPSDRVKPTPSPSPTPLPTPIPTPTRRPPNGEVFGLLPALPNGPSPGPSPNQSGSNDAPGPEPFWARALVATTTADENASAMIDFAIFFVLILIIGMLLSALLRRKDGTIPPRQVLALQGPLLFVGGLIALQLLLLIFKPSATVLSMTSVIAPFLAVLDSIFVLFVAGGVVAFGIYLSLQQFRASLRSASRTAAIGNVNPPPAATSVTPTTDHHTVTFSPTKITVVTSATGLVVLALSLGFLIVFLYWAGQYLHR